VTETLPLLLEFYRDKLAMLLRHQAGARLVSQYDVNNTYQYIINREETQLSWIAKAVQELGGTVDDITEPASQAASTDPAAIEADDATRAQAFVDRWRAKAAQMNDARHGLMINVILGEMLEQKRFFEQAREGREDLLGTRSSAAGERVGSVRSTRWIE